MRDLGEVDRQLAALGKAPPDLRALLGRVLGEDRSRERLERLLAELGAAAAAPARTAPIAHDTLTDGPFRAVSLPSVEESELDADTAALLSGFAASQHTSPAPSQPVSAATLPADEDEDDGPELDLQASGSEPPAGLELDVAAAQGSALAPADGTTAFADLFDFSEPPPPRVSASPLPAPFAPAAQTPDASRMDRRSSMLALLDQNLDPDDFPSSPPAASVPAEALPAAVEAGGEDEDGFELLVDDEELIEIVDDELEIMDDEKS